MTKLLRSDNPQPARERKLPSATGEMKRLMLSHACRFVNRVIFLVGPRSFRSRRAVERIGGVRAGSRPDSSGRESLVYRIEASDFACAKS